MTPAETHSVYVVPTSAIALSIALPLVRPRLYVTCGVMHVPSACFNRCRYGAGNDAMSRSEVRYGSELEDKIGFSRAVRIGNHIAVSGTGPVSPEGVIIGIDDVYRQTHVCLSQIMAAVYDSGVRVDDILRTRIMLVDIAHWESAALAHQEFFARIRPACTVFQVAGFIDPNWLVEVEADFVV